VFFILLIIKASLTLIQEALADNDTRLCIRYHYLWLLKYYSDKNIIVWNHQKTNRDYYYEIQSKEHKQQFEKLSYLYNHIWYGDFEISDAVFQQARTAFLHIVKPNHHGEFSEARSGLPILQNY
jgi:hypothetical protein